MANYKPQDAIDYARAFVKGIPVTDVDSQVCDVVQTLMWDYFPWNFTIKQQVKVSNSFLVDKQQDISPGLFPQYLYRLIWARLRRVDLVDGHYYKELTVVDMLPPVNPDMYGTYDLMEFVSYQPELDKIRLEGLIQITTGMQVQLDIDYQIQPTKITDSLLTTAFTMPDWFFPIFSEGVLWKFMVLGNDRRQGGMQIMKNGTIVYTGQMGVFYNALQARMIAERQFTQKLRYPAEGSLGAAMRGTSWSGIR